MAGSITIVVVDDHPLFREGVSSTLDAEPDLKVVGQGASAGEAIALAGELSPDVMLLDIDMPGRGFAAAEGVAETSPATRMIMLTVSEREEDLMACLKAGARGYVLKGVAGRELADIVRRVHSGETYVTPALATSVLVDLTERGARSEREARPLDALTDREREVLELVAAGHSNREIGERMFLAEKTVKHHMSSILQKLGVRNRVEAALLAHDIEPSSPPDNS